MKEQRTKKQASKISNSGDLISLTKLQEIKLLKPRFDNKKSVFKALQQAKNHPRNKRQKAVIADIIKSSLGFLWS